MKECLGSVIISGHLNGRVRRVDCMLYNPSIAELTVQHPDYSTLTNNKQVQNHDYTITKQ